MADNVDITAGSGTTIAADNIGGVNYQRTKLTWGVDGTATDASATNPLPVTAILPNLEKAEDAAHSSGDKGIQALGVRKDTAAALAGTDGDYTPLITDSAGRLHVTQSGLNLVDDAAFTPGTSKVVPVAGNYQFTVDTVSSGDVGVLRMTARRAAIIVSDYKNVVLTYADPTPSDSDIGSSSTDDFQIRDTSLHGLYIPVLEAGYNHLNIVIDITSAYDQDIVADCYFSYKAGASSGALVSFTISSGTTGTITIGCGGAVGQGGQAGGATAADKDYYNVPALNNSYRVVFRMKAGTSPSTGEHEVYISRGA